MNLHVPHHVLMLAAMGAAVLAWGIPAFADAAGDKVLAATDVATHRASTLKLGYEIVNHDSKGERTFEMNVQVKGGKRLIEFMSPPDLKGTKVLILSPAEMYAYLPAFGRVRRIASRTAEQGFLGLAFGIDDLGEFPLGAAYAATVDADSPASYRLGATPKAGQTPPYAKLELTISKDRMVPSQVEYYDAGGKHLKTQTRTNYTCSGDVCTAGEIKMVDDTSGAWTKLVQKSVKVNESISDDVFSRRNLGE